MIMFWTLPLIRDAYIENLPQDQNDLTTCLVANNAFGVNITGSVILPTV